MTNEQNNEVKEAEVLTPAEMTDAIRVLIADNKNANVIREDLKNSQHQNEQNIKLILDDLGNPRPRYERTPTRKLSVAAYEQAHGFISVDDLEECKIIKDLGEELEKYVGQVNSKFAQLRRQIETIPAPLNMHDLLMENQTFKELERKVTNLQSSEDERYALKREFNKFKLDYAELVHKFNCVINYIVGYTTGKEPETSAHILKAYEHTPKKE